MAFPINSSLFFSFGIAALVAWRLYSRVRRIVGRQRFSSVRPWITVIVFSLLIALLLFASLARPPSANGHTRRVRTRGGAGCLWDPTDQIRVDAFGPLLHSQRVVGHLPVAFVPRPRRVCFAGFYFSDSGAGVQSPGFMRSPLTLFIFGTLAGYYVIYAIGLIRRGRRVDTSGVA